MDFFKKDEILEFAKVANTAYDSNNNKHKLVAQKLKAGVWGKTQFWAERVINNLPGFDFSFSRMWSQRGWVDGERVSVFKPYTWARIHKKGDEDKDIYFTVGVDADSVALVYKLDYQYSENGKLSGEGERICEQLIKSSPASWMQINANELENYSWESLIEKTTQFIRDYTGLYDSVVKAAWSTNENRVSRLTWNTNGWIFPSGPLGKSTSKKSHEAKFGYGHEEWLFDTSKIIEGFHYGFLEPIRKEQETFSERTFNVWLYTIDGQSRKRYWVGILNNVDVIGTEEASRVKQIYTKKGWLREMEAQIVASGGNHSGFSNWQSIDLFNIRYKPADLNVNDPYFELPKYHPIYNQSRYAFIYMRDEFEVPLISEDHFKFTNKRELESDEDDRVQTKAYDRQPKSVEIVYLHRAISKKLIPLLKQQFGENNVVPEHSAGYGANRIDIVVRDKDGSLIFYEIKTYNSTSMSIRQSLGQLLEYAYWPNEKKAKELVIITPKQPDVQNVKMYMENLRNQFRIPVYYQSFDLETSTLSEKL